MDLKVAETPVATTAVALAAMAVDQLVAQTAAVQLHVLRTVLHHRHALLLLVLHKVADAATMVVAVAPVVDC